MFEVGPTTPQLTRQSVLPTRQMSKRYAVVLSDIHIGNDTSACWYRKAAHERPLTDLLRWIVASRERVREVVLLGDVFDVWTYPPGDKPPSMADIIRANSVLLGRAGPLADLVKAFPGNVRMLLGNHDMSITQADVDTLNASLGGNLARGEKIQLITGREYIVTDASGARTVFSHGHHWTMFNAPDSRSAWGTIPVGHFVSRAIAHRLKTRGHIAVDQRDHGNPSGLDPVSLWRSRSRRDDLVAFLLTYMCNEMKMPETARVVMPIGSDASAARAKVVFKDLFTLWADKLEPRGKGAIPVDALRAAMADKEGDDLAWFAQRLALRTASDLVVMGHTHKPVGGLIVSPVNYINTGYLCAAKPDLKAKIKQLTFAQVDLERATAEVLALIPGPGGHTIALANAPKFSSVVMHGAMDFSCYTRIENRSDQPLRLVKFSKTAASHWVIPPPVHIAPRSRANIWLQDTLGMRGSAGTFTYNDGRRTLEFAVECPFVGSNVARSPVPYITRTGSNAWRRGAVDSGGHPLQVRCVVEALRPAVRFAQPPPGPAAARPAVIAR